MVDFILSFHQEPDAYTSQLNCDEYIINAKSLSTMIANTPELVNTCIINVTFNLY